MKNKAMGAKAYSHGGLAQLGIFPHGYLLIIGYLGINT